MKIKTAVLDSSPLLLWLAGRTDPLIIARFKHLSMFQQDDYEILERFLGSFEVIATTPHVLTEASNHAHHLKGALGAALLRALATFAFDSPEYFRDARSLSQRSEFIPYGLTDCALCDLSDEITVITTDYRLAGYLKKHGKHSVNLNHLRQARLLP